MSNFALKTYYEDDLNLMYQNMYLASEGYLYSNTSSVRIPY